MKALEMKSLKALSGRYTGAGRRPLAGLLDDGLLDALALGEGDPGLGALADGEDITEASSELVARGILDVDRLEAALVLLPVLDQPHPARVPPSRHHHHVTHVEFNIVDNLAAL